MEEGSGGRRKGVAVRSLPVIFLPGCVCVREGVFEGDFELFLQGSLSLSLSLSRPNILSAGFTADLSHPPLCCSDWPTDTEKRERERERKGEREAVLFSCCTYTL